MRKAFLVSPMLFALSSVAFAGCLEEVSTFAEKICGQIQTSGGRQLTEADGQLKAEVSGIVRKVLGNAGGEINAKHLRDAYENVLREDLAKELFNVRECRVKMVEVGRAEACKPVVSYKTCRHPDFGRVGWQKAETINQSSGRVDGGSNPTNWCNQLIAQYVSARSLGPNYEAVVLDTSEESDKDWKGHVTYNYHCRVEIRSVPLYAERTDPRCGTVTR